MVTWLIGAVAFLLLSLFLARAQDEVNEVLRAGFAGLVEPLHLLISAVEDVRGWLRGRLAGFLGPLGSMDRWLPGLGRRAFNLIFSFLGYAIFVGGELLLITETFKKEGYPGSWALLLALTLITAPILVEFARQARPWFIQLAAALANGLALGILLALGFQRALGISPEDPRFPIRIGELVVEGDVFLIHVALPVLLFTLGFVMAPRLIEAFHDLVTAPLIILAVIGMGIPYAGLSVMDLFIRLISIFIQGIWVFLTHLVPLLALPGQIVWNAIAGSSMGRRLGMKPIQKEPVLSPNGHHNDWNRDPEPKPEELPDLWD